MGGNEGAVLLKRFRLRCRKFQIKRDWFLQLLMWETVELNMFCDDCCEIFMTDLPNSSLRAKQNITDPWPVEVPWIFYVYHILIHFSRLQDTGWHQLFGLWRLTWQVYVFCCLMKNICWTISDSKFLCQHDHWNVNPTEASFDHDDSDLSSLCALHPSCSILRLSDGSFVRTCGEGTMGLLVIFWIFNIGRPRGPWAVVKTRLPAIYTGFWCTSYFWWMMKGWFMVDLWLFNGWFIVVNWW